MSDKVTIPRSYAGQIGVADVTNAVKRHYVPLHIRAANNNTTTGIMFGGNGTTAPSIFERNVTLERLIVTGRTRTTIGGKTTIFYGRLMNGASTLFNLAISSATTVSERWHNKSTLPAIAHAGAATKLSLNFITRNQFTRVSVVLVLREREDD